MSEMNKPWNVWLDAEIIDACLDGNQKAWQALVSRYKRLVYSVPVKWGLSPEDAVDIFQGVWLDCFRQLASLRDMERLQPWLIRVAVRKCHRFSTDKRARHEDSMPQEDLEELLGIEDPRPSYQAIASRLGLSENSIGFTRERCLENLKKVLHELGYRP